MRTILFMRLLLCSVTLLLLSTLPVYPTGPSRVRTDHWIVEKDQVETRELWVQADAAETYGVMNRTLFLLAESALLDGSFGQDVWVIASAITKQGVALQNLRMFGQSRVHISGVVKGNCMVASLESIETGPDAVLQGNALFAARSVTLHGRAQGDVSVWTQQAVIGGQINGNLRVYGPKPSFLEGTRVEGDVWVTVREWVPPPHVHIGGNVHFITAKAVDEAKSARWRTQILLFSSASLTGTLLLVLMPGFIGRAVRHIRRGFWKSLLIGTAAFVLIPLAILLLSVSIIGLPAAALLGGMHLALIYLSKIVTGLALGGIMLQRSGPQSLPTAIAALIVGLLFLYILANVPMFGMIVMVGIWLVGLGGLLLSLVPSLANRFSR